MISQLLNITSIDELQSPVPRNSEIRYICHAAREVLLAEPSLLELAAPVKIVGDVRGQFFDLLRLFGQFGYPGAVNYLFLGGFVSDIRPHSVKQGFNTLLLLLCFKIKYPKNFFLLRGNHEFAWASRVSHMWSTLIDVFNSLPIAAIIGSKIFCVHGGLSPSLSSLDDIRNIQGPTEVPESGLLHDLLWSNPSESSPDWERDGHNLSYHFGNRVIDRFLNQHDLAFMCRAHVALHRGYKFWNGRKLVSIFSAPMYREGSNNRGACMVVSEDLSCNFELLKPDK
ncbi:Metallo-dependent phosphatase-like protein [Roridomyces roridus]|uniref:Serine/threonine-protein phosphatase n=1 Tax=Roridomyces roridus TaxID=1738132 RepID=A0AAD7FB35_9AGAR|nr:Metallo-dependent phosphatase-like protein [Roridomyces roridus]